jgi:molybdopterin/thiamine biosynthesis adenylyltransferase
MVAPPILSSGEVERYARQLVLREIGGPGQQRLKAARVLVVGAGGLGSPAALYLAAAGIGHIGLLDPDRVSLSNLQRQVLFTTPDLGTAKVAAGAAHLAALNPEITVSAHDARLDALNADALIAGYDIILDGTDDFATRFEVNSACLRLRRPLVSGALGRWIGQVGVFGLEDGPCYRCLVPETPPDAETCQAVGVVGALAGVIGAMMALETVKLATGIVQGLAGRLLVYDALAGETRTLRLPRDPDCTACRDRSRMDRTVDLSGDHR